MEARSEKILNEEMKEFVCVKIACKVFNRALRVFLLLNSMKKKKVITTNSDLLYIH